MAINTHRLLIDFATTDGLVHFLSKLAEHELIPADAVARDNEIPGRTLVDFKEYVIKRGPSLKDVKLP